VGAAATRYHTITPSMPWTTLVGVYDEDYRGDAYTFSHVSELSLPPHPASAWPSTLTLGVASRMQPPPLERCPMLALRPHARAGPARSRRVVFIASNGMRWEEQADGRCDVPCARRYHVDEDSGMIMLHHTSPIVTYRARAEDGRLAREDECHVLSDITWLPPTLLPGWEDPEEEDVEDKANQGRRNQNNSHHHQNHPPNSNRKRRQRAHRDATEQAQDLEPADHNRHILERLRRARTRSIQKQISDQRLVLHLGCRVATYHVASWRAVDLMGLRPETDELAAQHEPEPTRPVVSRCI
jgi:hypothetical protein